MSANGVSGPHGRDQTGPPGPPPQAVNLDGVTFSDVLRAVNPLQYLPVVGTIYRLATGDAAPTGMRIAVSAVMGVLTGGPIGLLGSIVGALAEQFLHVEGRIKDALATPATNSAPASPVGPAGPPEATHAQAEADLGQRPAAAPFPERAPFTQAVNAYHAAGLLGAV